MWKLHRFVCPIRSASGDTKTSGTQSVQRKGENPNRPSNVNEWLHYNNNDRSSIVIINGWSQQLMNDGNKWLNYLDNERGSMKPTKGWQHKFYSITGRSGNFNWEKLKRRGHEEASPVYKATTVNPGNDQPERSSNRNISRWCHQWHWKTVTSDYTIEKWRKIN